MPDPTPIRLVGRGRDTSADSHGGKAIWMATASLTVLCLVVPAIAAMGPATASVPAAISAAPTTTAPVPNTTVSRYESTADPSALNAQGAADGRAGLSGVAVLDFGRSAESDGVPSTLDFATHLDPLSSLVTAVEAYANGYRQTAPHGASMTVLLGTNDSCGTGQPCGTGTCGCVNEPADYVSWGQEWGHAVAQIGAYLTATSSTYQATALAGGGYDAEPAYDPAFTNTFDVVAGYDDVTDLPMIDYGSIDGGPTADGFWTPEQMYLVANGLRPDAALPEIYHPGMADQWAALSHWAAVNAGGPMVFAGVLTQAPHGYTPDEGAAALHTALSTDFPDTAQPSWLWSSNMESGG